MLRPKARHGVVHLVGTASMHNSMGEAASLHKSMAVASLNVWAMQPL